MSMPIKLNVFLHQSLSFIILIILTYGFFISANVQAFNDLFLSK